MRVVPDWQMQIGKGVVRNGRNLHIDDAVKIKVTKVLKFKLGKALKDTVNWPSWRGDKRQYMLGC